MTDSLPPAPGHPDNATLVRYLDGVCADAEREDVERWLASNPAHRAELAALQAAWNPPAIPQADQDDQMWQWIAARMDQPHPRPVLLPASASPKSPWRRVAAIAAVLALVAGGVLSLWFPQATRQALAGAWFAGSAASRELVAPRGSRAASNLPDGSSIVLGPESRLRIPATFEAGVGARDIYLEGEAFFQVIHNAKRPFRVHTTHGVVEDLGTEFLVSAYPEAGATRAVVVSGLVELSNGRAHQAAGSRVTLGAGDLARVDATGGITVARHIDPAPYVSWTAGKLVLDNVPVQEAVAMLGRWYDVEIRVADAALARRRVSATFNNDPLTQVLRVLEVALGASAQRAGQRIVLQSR